MTRTMSAKLNAELIGEFLEEIDYAGPVNREVLRAYAPLVAAAGAPGTALWRSAVHLAAQRVDGPPPGPEALLGASEASQRDNLARRTVQLLVEAGHSEPIPPETADAARPLAQLAGIPGLAYWNLAVQLLAASGGDVPSATRLQELIDQEKARLQAQRQRTTAEARERAAADHDRAGAYVARVRAETGAGPTWRELSEHLDWPAEWPSYALEAAVRHLVKIGVLRCTHAPRSLDVRRRKEISS